MMSKHEELKRAAALGARPGTFPPGMDPSQAVGRPARLEGVRGDRSSAWIAIDRIERDPDQPREEFDEDGLARLAESLKTRGQLQPIRVRWDGARGHTWCWPASGGGEQRGWPAWRNCNA